MRAKELFDKAREKDALTCVRGKMIMAFSEETLAQLISNSMVDGAQLVLGHNLKPAK